MVKYVIVAFRVNKLPSVLYAKTNDINEIQKYVERAFIKYEADFISIRRVVEE